MPTTVFADVKHIHQSDLARRWCISPRTLERWRVEGHGPIYLKIGGRVIYRLADVEAYEAAQIRLPANEPNPLAAGRRQ